MEIAEVFGRNRRRRILEQCARRGGLRECDHVAQRPRARKHHRNAIEAERYAAVRRRACTERVEQKAESRLRHSVVYTEQTENPALQRRIVDANAASAQLSAVEHDVIGKSTNFLRLAVEKPEILRVGSGEWMMYRAQRSVLLANEHRKVRDPEKRPRPRADHLEACGDVLSDAVEGRIAHVLGTRNEEAKHTLLESELLAGSFGQKLRRGSFDSTGSSLEPYETTSARRFRDRLDVVHLLARERCTARNSDASHPAA